MPHPLTEVRALEPIPQSFVASLFLAGPRRASGEASDPWHQQALALLRAAGYEGIVYLPEAREGTAPASLDEERLGRWESEALRHADAVLFWLPEDQPADAPLAEHWGALRRSGRVVIGGGAAARARQPLWFDGKLRIPSAASLPDTVQLLWPLLRPGALRRGGERAVPLHLWRSPSFQRWYRALRGAGNHLDDLDVEWSYRLRAPTGRPPLIFALRPRIWVRAERRHKAGEVVVGRADVSATVLYHRGAAALDTEIALVREFRSAGGNGTGFVWELPGGSAEHAADRDHDPRVTAAREVEEETGLRIHPDQLQEVPQGARQVAATILSHRAHLFRAELQDEQLAQLRQTEREGRSHGANAGERCYVVMRSLRQILDGGELDWGQVGMILLALARPGDGPGDRPGEPKP